MRPHIIQLSNVNQEFLNDQKRDKIVNSLTELRDIMEHGMYKQDLQMYIDVLNKVEFKKVEHKKEKGKKA